MAPATLHEFAWITMKMGKTAFKGTQVIGFAGDKQYVVAQDSSEDNIVRGDDSIQAPGRIMVDPAKWLEKWHDVGEDGTKYVRYGIAIGPPAKDSLPQTPLSGTRGL